MTYYYGDRWLREVIGDQANAVPIGGLVSRPTNYNGICTSESCQVRFRQRRPIMIIARAPGNQSCPNCRGALYWEKVKKIK